MNNSYDKYGIFCSLLTFPYKIFTSISIFNHNSVEIYLITFIFDSVDILIITHFVPLMYLVSINIIRYNLMYCITLMFMTLYCSKKLSCINSTRDMIHKSYCKTNYDYCMLCCYVRTSREIKIVIRYLINGQETQLLYRNLRYFCLRKMNSIYISYLLFSNQNIWFALEPFTA